MKRRSFLKGSAIIGAVTTLPGIVTAHSGMYSSERYRKVKQILKAGKSMVGTLPILRAFAGNHTDLVSPFVLFDEFGPVEIKAGTDALKVEAHPHAGVTPTTYFLEGSGHHKDSLNYDFQINTGEFMMFNSGSGAIHMEESGEHLKENGGTLHGFQIWLNMPSKFKWSDPTTLVHKDGAMPVIMHKDFEAKVIMGSLFNHTSAVETLSPTFYYHIKLNPNARLDIPTDLTHNAFVYNIHGQLEIEDRKTLEANQIALYERGKSDINFYTKDGAEFFLLGGQPLNEIVYSYGPFVMNTAAEINKCILNYNSGKMGDPAVVN